MNCALKTLVDKRKAVKGEIYTMEIILTGYDLDAVWHDSTEKIKPNEARLTSKINGLRIDLLDLRNAIRAIQNGALSNE
jgi:hypothetical protein